MAVSVDLWILVSPARVCMCRLHCQLIGPLLGTCVLPRRAWVSGPRESGRISLRLGIQQEPELHSLPLRSGWKTPPILGGRCAGVGTCGANDGFSCWMGTVLFLESAPWAGTQGSILSLGPLSAPTKALIYLF